MFYVAEALLFEMKKGLTFRKHGGMHAAFGEHFAKKGELDPKFHGYLLDAFEGRLEADYNVEIFLTEAAVNEMIARPKEFLNTAQVYLKK